MREIILEKLKNEKRRTCLIGHSDTTPTNAHKPLAFSCSEDLMNVYLMDDKKAAIIERLEQANEKLKDVRKEIHEAVLAAQEIGLIVTEDILIMHDVPLEERRKEAKKPLYILRYE